MNTMKFKTICNVAASAVHTCLQNPDAKIGQIGNIRTVEITGIPDSASPAEVLKAWRETSDVSWLWNDGEYARHSYRFDEIGNGRIILGEKA